MSRLDWQLWFLALLPEIQIVNRKWFLRMILGILEMRSSTLSLINSDNIEAVSLKSSSSPLYRVSIVRLDYSSSSSSNSTDAFTCSEPRIIIPPTSIETLRSKLEIIEMRAAEKQAAQDKKNASDLIRSFVKALRDKKSSSASATTSSSSEKKSSIAGSVNERVGHNVVNVDENAPTARVPVTIKKNL